MADEKDPPGADKRFKVVEVKPEDLDPKRPGERREESGWSNHADTWPGSTAETDNVAGGERREKSGWSNHADTWPGSTAETDNVAGGERRDKSRWSSHADVWPGSSAPTEKGAEDKEPPGSDET